MSSHRQAQHAVSLCSSLRAIPQARSEAAARGHTRIVQLLDAYELALVRQLEQLERLSAE